MYTTLNRIRKLQSCTGGWETLLKYLGKTKPDDEPLPLLTILDAAGFEYTLQCFFAVEGFEKEKLLLALTYAREVEHLMPVKLKEVLDVFERYVNGLATQEEFDAARGAADANTGWASAKSSWCIADTAPNSARAVAWFATRSVLSVASAASAAARAAARAAWIQTWTCASAAARAAAAARADTADVDDAAANAASYTHSTILAKQETQLRQLLEKNT